MEFSPAAIYQRALFDGGIPATSVGVSNIQQEYDRLVMLQVIFTMKPTSMGPVTVAVLEDPCGNLIQIVQQ